MQLASSPADADGPAIGKREQGVADRRRRLIKAATELLTEREDGSFSMPELARRAQVSLATPYNLFGSKAAVLAQVFERLAHGFNRDPAWMSGLGAADRILGVIDRLTLAYEQQGRLFRSLWRALYGLDLAEQGDLNLSLSNEIVRPLVNGLATDRLLIENVPAHVLELTLARIFEANFEQWAAQDWTASQLRDHLQAGFALVFIGLVGPADKARLNDAMQDAAQRLPVAPTARDVTNP
ncbi:TetR/AcrR family transcriptional regulator [Croceicoccus sp. F390]|uniref:TetR/AcrR family transcriptional regulator n=1 Tax=Croceicoccus esteveae TaxID=3075597 RepID=A0ABU2ZKB3_9SPHN|nr:TetR/AcrR family transcriptional regulator [Croceicoccus sp. F390]MDT0576014.1 TetR/AcrR family transcriptional regulator [Croceicoccus sp. F390]